MKRATSTCNPGERVLSWICPWVCAAVVSIGAFPASAVITDSEGETTILHRTGELRFDKPISIPISSRPVGVATVDLDRAGTGDRFHDLVVLTSDGLHLLENRPEEGYLGLDSSTAIRIGEINAPAEGWRRGLIRTVPREDGPPFLVTFTDDGLRLFQVAEGFKGSGDGSSVAPLVDREPTDQGSGGGSPLDLETTVQSSTPAVVAFSDNGVLVYAIRSEVCDDPKYCLEKAGTPDFSLIAEGLLWTDRNNVTATVFDHDPLSIIAGDRWCNPDNTNCLITLGVKIYGLTDACDEQTTNWECYQDNDVTGFQLLDTFDFEAFGLVPLDLAMIDRRRQDGEKTLVSISRGMGTAEVHLRGGAGLSMLASVPTTAALRRRLVAVADLGANPDGTPDGREDVVALVPLSGREAELHAFRDFFPRPGVPSLLPTFPPHSITSESGELHIVDMTFGYFNADEVLDIVLVDAEGSRLIVLPGEPLPEATFVSVSVHGHRGSCSALGELNVEGPGCGPTAFPVDNVEEIDAFSRDLLAAVDSINEARRPSDGSAPSLRPVRFIGVNGHWEDLTTSGAAAMIGGRALWIAAMHVPAPTCFENIWPLMLLAEGPEKANLFSSGPDYRPKEFWDAVVFMVIPSLFPVTSTVPSCIIPLPNRGALARFAMAGAATIVEGWGVSNGRSGSAEASDDLTAAIERAVSMARSDTVQCGQVLVDTIAHSRGAPVLSEALRSLTTTELGYNARVSMTLLDGIDASFLPLGNAACGNGDSCRPWAKAGFLSGDPRIEAVGNVDLSSGFAALPSQALPLQPAVEATGFLALGMPLGGVASHVIGLPTGHDRWNYLVNEAPVAGNRPRPSERVFGRADPPTTHDEFQNHFWVGSNRAVLDGTESGFMPVSQLTMRNVSGLGTLLGDDPRASIPNFRGWFRTLEEDVSGEFLRLPVECGGPGTALPAVLNPTIRLSPFGGHVQRELVKDHDFNQTRGLVRNARLLDDYADVLKVAVPADLHMYVDAFLEPAARGTFPPTGVWKPKQLQSCRRDASVPTPESQLDSATVVLGQAEDGIITALRDESMPRRAVRQLRAIESELSDVRSRIQERRAVDEETIRGLADRLIRVETLCKRCQGSSQQAVRRTQLATGRLLELTRSIHRTSVDDGREDSPCVLALGTDEQPIAQVLLDRAINPRVGLPPVASEVPSACDSDCLEPMTASVAEDLGDFTHAWSLEIGDVASSGFSDRIQYLKRLLAGATHTGESFARFLEKEATLAQHLAPASTLADHLLIEVEYRLTGPNGRIRLSISGRGIDVTRSRTASSNWSNERDRISLRVSRDGDKDRAADILTITGREVDVFRVSARRHGPVVSEVNGHLYDLVLIEGGVDWDHAQAVASRTFRNSKKGVLASIHDTRVLEDLVKQLEIDIPVWIGARGEAKSPRDFAWQDGSDFDLAPWASDTIFTADSERPAYVFLDVKDGRLQFRHSPQQSTVGGKPFSFLIDFGVANQHRSP